MLISSGCGVGFNENTGGDGGRGDARPVMANVLGYDRVSAEDGDHTDWKSVKLEDAGAVKVTIWWDDPSAVAATLEVRDQLGNAIPGALLKHNPSSRKEVLGPIKLAKGTSFIRVEASKGASVYSLEVQLEEDSPSGGGPDL
jgi:hypothetical protein